MGISGINFMMEICIVLEAISLILIIVTIIFMVFINGLIKKQKENISFLHRRAREDQRREDAARDQTIQQASKKKLDRTNRKAGS